MLNAYDIAYGLGVGLAAPFWLLKGSARRKVLNAFRQRMGYVAPRDPAGQPTRPPGASTPWRSIASRWSKRTSTLT